MAITKTALLWLVIAAATTLQGMAQPARDTTLTAPDLTSVIIARDAFGVPHISASTEVALFYGQGYAAAEDRLFQMESFRRIALGREAEIYGPSSLSVDQATITLVYTDAERTAQFNALSAELKTMLTAYKDGVNAYQADVNSDPATFKPIEYATLNIPVVDWTEEDLVAIIQAFMIGFGQNGGDELSLLAELTTLGQTAFDLKYPINDPTAPTTIAAGATALPQTWGYSGMSVSAEATKSVGELRDRALSGMPKFGSFAAGISTTKSTSGNVLLLGAPQMGPPEIGQPSRTMEVELISPSFHIGGMTVPGAPGVIIGHNESFAWTMTSGQSDNTDLFVEATNVAGTEYFFNGVFNPFEAIANNIPVLGQADDAFVHFRTGHGPVVGSDLPNQQAYSLQMTFWGQEMLMMQGFYEIWSATTEAEFSTALQQLPMSFNVLYAGEHTGTGSQIVKYWHAGKYQDRTDGVDPRLPHSGIGDEEWQGFIPFAGLPQADHTTQDYFVNWNNKPIASWDQGDNMSWIVGNVFRDRVNTLDAFVGSTTPFSFADLKNIPATINDHGTYTQAIEIAPVGVTKRALAATFTDESLNPPGQSGFISLAQDTSAHFRDQWPLHLAFGFKDMIFSPESLPVVLTAFRGVVDESDVTFFWTTGSSAAASRFEIQQAVEPGLGAASEWMAIASVDGNSGADGSLHHSFRINDLAAGYHLFRLRIVDLDGSVAYSPTESVLIGPVGAYELSDAYPNPSASQAAFTFTLRESGQATIEVFDILGRRMLRVHNGELAADERHHFAIDVDHLRSGTYTIVARSGGFVGRRSMTVVH